MTAKASLISVLFNVPQRNEIERVHRVLLYATVGPILPVFAIRLLPQIDGPEIRVSLTVALIALVFSSLIRIGLVVAAIRQEGEYLGYDKEREINSDGIIIPGLTRVYVFRYWHKIASAMLIVGYVASLFLMIAVVWG